MKLDLKEQERAAKKFVADWLDKGNEKSDTQNFWLRLLHDVYGVEDPTSYIQFEKRVKNQYTRNVNFIDGYISNTLVLIEQKDIKIDLSKSELRSGKMVTPYEQAKGYADSLRSSEKPNWIITSNFKEFQIYDMDQVEPDKSVVCISLNDLPKRAHEMNFLVSETDHHLAKEMALSIQAGDLVGEMYDTLSRQYHAVLSLDDKVIDNHLNRLCVRLVFCLYAEDSGLFGTKTAFHDYLSQFDTKHLRKALVDLFKVLNTKIEDRDPFMDDDLAAFPYVNGGLFADDDLMIPQFTDELKDLLLSHASSGFDWSDISPTIFGAVFESTLNPETRRSGGMHYTSIENIHKVIDPLFLDDLKQELKEIKQLKQAKTIERRINEFQEKLASLTFLDPACGSGNFLTETYLSIRRLENQAIAYKNKNQGQWLFDNVDSPIKVSINQFYGIEINDFAVTVAKTALWIAECQMMKETEDIILADLDFLPLTTNASIIEGNALRMDWNDVISSDKVNYIMGNPPFIGQGLRTPEQSDDMAMIFGRGNIVTKQDYVVCWYKKALDFVKTSSEIIICSFVSTNSICQGESVPTFWKQMIEEGAVINFAYTSFIWDSEANQKAHVHCVIVGFTSAEINKPKKIYYDGKNVVIAEHINSYLLDAPDIWITNRTNINKNNKPKITTGSPPTDAGGLLLTHEEMLYFKKKYPELKEYIRPFIGAKEFLYDKTGSHSRYCFWFTDAAPNVYAHIPEIKDRFKKVVELRKKSSASRINKMAKYPYLFCQNRQPTKNYLVIPRHSSEKREYIPIGFMTPKEIVGDACTIIPNISIFEFGILTSSVHMYWMKVMAGRLEMRYRYSPLIYNNFPWPNINDEIKNKIEDSALNILNIRSNYLDSNLAELYDPLTMPLELRKAHEENDKAVMKMYGFKPSMSEEEIVAELMKMYQELTK